MRCPECQWPMGLAREERGIRVWRCEKCKREKRGVTKGELLMSWRVPVKLQEKAVLVLALLALAMPVRAQTVASPVQVTSQVPTLSGNNTFSGNETFNGTVTGNNNFLNNGICECTGTTTFDTGLNVLGLTNASGGLLVAQTVSNDASGLKHKRVSTGSIAANTDAAVAVTWTTGFANANYTVTCDVQDVTASASSLKVIHFDTVTAFTVTVRVRNDSAGALTGTLHCIAMHD